MRTLVVTAHPDDVDFSAAGSVATWTAEGHEVAYCICTSGEAGEAPAEVARAGVAALREAEQRAAAAAVGVTDVVFLGHPDGALVPSIELRCDISRQVRRFRPDRVVCQSPQRRWDSIYASHPDHLAAGEAAICAVYPDARNPHAHVGLLDEGLEPWTVTELLVTAADAAAGRVHAVDITDAFPRKVAALRAHASQTSGIADLEGFLRGWSAAAAAAAGMPEGRLAEAFLRMDVR